MDSKYLRHFFHIINVLAVSAIYIGLAGRAYPMVGHDYCYFLPRLFDTFLYERLNGPLSVQWYTPGFGSGLPAFPNPQQVQFSLPQALLWVADPWRAVMLSALLFVAIGYAGAFLLAHRHLKLSWTASVLAALFFSLNGFFLNHFIVGHVGYLAFPLLPALLALLLEAERPVLLIAALGGLVVASLIYTAGFYLAIIFALSIAICVPLIFLIQPDALHWKRFAANAAGAALIGGAISASKIAAVLAFMAQFPRLSSAKVTVGILERTIAIFFELTAGTLLLPVWVLSGHSPAAFPAALSEMTGVRAGVWELDLAVSSVLVALILIGAIFVIRRSLHQGKKAVSFAQAAALVVLSGVLLVAVQYTIAGGFLYDALKELPVFRSLHNNTRNAAAFILPAAIFGAWSFHRFLEKQASSPRAAIAWVALVFYSFSPYLMLSPQRYVSNCDASALVDLYQQHHSGPVPAVERVVVSNEDVSLDLSVSNRWVYEPIFGYSLENYHPLTAPGSVFDVENGYFNMTHPAGLVYPESSGLEPFERFGIDERELLEQFAARRRVDWPLPAWQVAANWLSVLGVTAAAIGMIVGFLAPRSARRSA